jgi:hypothetical protein
MNLTTPAGTHHHPAGRAASLAGHHGHAHFWQRAYSRRGIVRGAGGLALLGLAGGARHALAQDSTNATPTWAEVAMPKPIAGGGFEVEGEVLHVYDYLPGNEPSTIGDFRGLVAINHLQGEGTVTRGGSGSGGGGISTPSATGDRLVYDADMRVMKGLYIGEDGEEHQGTFGFI